MSSDQQSPPRKRDRGSTIERVLSMLEFIASHDGEYDKPGFVAALGYPKAAGTKLVDEMIAEGLLQESILKRVVIGPRFRGIALDTLNNSEIQAVVTTLLQELSEEIGETCGISLPNGIEMLYFLRVEANWPLQIYLPPGTGVPITATASGKMYLASLPETVRELVVQNIGLESYTEHTLVNIHKLLAELSATAQRGYARDEGEFIDGMSAVAVPIGTSRFKLGFLFCHAPTFRKNVTALEAFIPQMQATAARIVQALEEFYQ